MPADASHNNHYLVAGGNLIVEHMLGAGREALAKAQLAVGRKSDSSSDSDSERPSYRNEKLPPSAAAAAREERPAVSASDERPIASGRDVPPTERDRAAAGAGGDGGLRREPLQVKPAWVDPSPAGVPDLGLGDPMHARVLDDYKWRRLEARMNRQRDVGGQGVAGAVRGPSRAAELVAKHEEVSIRISNSLSPKQ